VLGRRVAVYGGGNTAMDAARTAKRLGADDTLIVYRRDREKMPAHEEEEEAAAAEIEGVTINWLRTISGFEGPAMTVEVMELDEAGHPRPTGCGNCSFMCPHSVIRSTFYPEGALDAAPDGFASAPIDARGLPGTRFTLQVYAEDCTGCGLCVEACPVTAPPTAARLEEGRKAINLEPAGPEATRRDVAFFETLPVVDRSRVDFGTVRGTQFLQPLFEFSGACAGCGETPYLKLLSQLFGDRLLVANATGCSSIYGGNLPTTPWTRNAAGQGPAWSNSLFEDNAEFGLGFRLAADQHLRLARERLAGLRDAVGAELADAVLDAPQSSPGGTTPRTPSLQPLRRARHREGRPAAPQRDGPAVQGDRERVLAAHQVRPDAAGDGREPVPARLAEAPHTAVRLHGGGVAVPGARQDRPGRGRAARGARRRRGDQAVGQLRGAGRQRS
jgi:ferredoxin